jgi:hypothetical protein
MLLISCWFAVVPIAKWFGFHVDPTVEVIKNTSSAIDFATLYMGNNVIHVRYDFSSTTLKKSLRNW